MIMRERCSDNRCLSEPLTIELVRLLGLSAVLWCCMLPVSLSCSRVLRELLAAGRGGGASSASRGRHTRAATSVDTKRTQNEAKTPQMK
jgi:hypothetical protein